MLLFAHSLFLAELLHYYFTVGTGVEHTNTMTEYCQDLR